MKRSLTAVCGFLFLVGSCSYEKPTYVPPFNQPLQASLPPGFVYVDDIAPSVRVRLKYAEKDNFVGRPLDGYHGKRAILRRPAATALKGAAKALAAQGYCIIIYDAYRPHTAVLDIARWGDDPSDQKTKAKYYPNIDKTTVFGNHYVRNFSEHSRGVALDVSLVDLKTGSPVDMGGHHDLLDPSSATDSPLVTPRQHAHRMVLKKAFESNGFRNYAPEWWHYYLRNEPDSTLYLYFPIWDGMKTPHL